MHGKKKKSIASQMPASTDDWSGGENMSLLQKQ
jgi:hypothetical protein